MRKTWPYKRQNLLKSVSNREIKSLENNLSVKATNTPKIVIEKPPIAAEPKTVIKPKKVS